MNKETRNYKAKAFLRYVETGKIQPPKDIVLDILRKSGDELKRAEIIQKFQEREDCKDSEVGYIVSAELEKLMKSGDVVKIRHGIYKAVQK